MIQKKLNNGRVHSSLLLYVICVISVLMMNLVNMSRGLGMEQRQQMEINANEVIHNLRQEEIKHPEDEILAKIREVANYQDIVDDELIRQTINEIDIMKTEQNEFIIHKMSYKTKFSDLSVEEQQKQIAKHFVKVATNIFNSLTNRDVLNTAVNILRSINDIDYNTNNEIFFKQFNQMFYHSKKLLNATITPQLANIYLRDTRNLFENINKNNENFEQLERDLQTGIRKQKYSFLYNGRRYSIFLQSKDVGAHFGSIYQCIDEQNQEQNK